MWVVMVLLGGLVALGSGTYELLLQRRLRREGNRTGGQVVRHDVRHSKDGKISFAIVAFDDVQGIRHTFQARSSGVKHLPVGGHVPVRYLPDAPNSARIDLARRRRGEIAFAFLIGAGFTTIGIWMLATGR